YSNTAQFHPVTNFIMSKKQAPAAAVVEAGDTPIDPPAETKGTGTFTFSDGSRYEGDYESFQFMTMRHGHGTFWCGPEKYVGSWQKDQMDGQGRYEFASGAVYEGEFKVNLFTGEGTYRWSDGAWYKGQWRDNNQAIYACNMAGHFHQLTSEPKTFLRGSEAIDQIPEPYTKATDMGCPVCGQKNLKYAVPWTPHGNQKIFACSESHAQQILDNPNDYFIKKPDNDTSQFCQGATGMYDGFQSAINGFCPRIYFETWVLDTGVKYAFAFLGVLLLGITVEALVEAQSILQKRLTRRYAITVWVDPSDDDALTKELLACDTPRPIARRLPLWCKAILAIVYMFAMAGAYLLMLVVMTYETGFFFAAIIGLGFGFYFFKDTDEVVMEGNIDPCCST
ncbi:transmembrane protein, partial [Thraustotheca clavata]